MMPGIFISLLYQDLQIDSTPVQRSFMHRGSTGSVLWLKVYAAKSPMGTNPGLQANKI